MIPTKGSRAREHVCRMIATARKTPSRKALVQFASALCCTFCFCCFFFANFAHDTKFASGTVAMCVLFDQTETLAQCQNSPTQFLRWNFPTTIQLLFMEFQNSKHNRVCLCFFSNCLLWVCVSPFRHIYELFMQQSKAKVTHIWSDHILILRFIPFIRKKKDKQRSAATASAIAAVSNRWKKAYAISSASAIPCWHVQTIRWSDEERTENFK